MEPTKQVKPTDFNSPVKPTWCPGCGNFAILNGLRGAFTEMNISPSDAILVFDIGCNSNMADKINIFGFKGLHGRALPTAAGIYIANSKMPVITVSGDGGLMDEGMHHFIHTARNNYDITVILHNNCNFGLTTGQETPTTPQGQPMAATPFGAVGTRLNPVHLALLSGATFIANGWTGNTKQIVDLIQKGIKHKGFSLINIYQDCPTYNKFEDLAWLREHVYEVNEQEGYDPSDKSKAFAVTDYDTGKRPVGLIYQDLNSVPFLQRLGYRNDVDSTLIEEVVKTDINDLMQQYK